MFPTSRREDAPRRSARRHARRSGLIVAFALVPAILGAATVVTAQAPSSRPPLTRPTTTFTSVLSGPASTPSARLDLLADTSGVTMTGSLTDAEAQAQFGRPVAVVPPEPAVRAQSKAPPGRIRARGAATWYCLAGVSACHRDYGGGMYAAAGPELRVGDWRGRNVTVCAGDDCVRVTLIDWCACPGDRVIDLYGDAFRRLAPLGTGILRVSVRW